VNELNSLDCDGEKARLLSGDWDKIEIVTGERGKGMSALAIQIERRTVREQPKDLLARYHRWCVQNNSLIHMILYAILGPCYLFMGLVIFKDGTLEILATILITGSCVMFIGLGAAMERYAHGGNDHDKPDS